MARKSRKETVVLPAPEMDTTCRAGVYVRLSVEDKHTHTASIETQQLIIARYLEQNPEIIVVQTYIDNGATGTNFHRPGFQQMLSDISAPMSSGVVQSLKWAAQEAARRTGTNGSLFPTIIRQSLTKNYLKRCRLCSAVSPCRPRKPGSTH